MTGELKKRLNRPSNIPQKPTFPDLNYSALIGWPVYEAMSALLHSVNQKVWSWSAWAEEAMVLGCTGRGSCGPGVHGQRSEGTRILSLGR